MRTLSKLTVDDLEDNRAFSTFIEFQTEYRIIKISPIHCSWYYLQFKDNYRIFGTKTPFPVWRFVPTKTGNWKRSNCPVVYEKKLLNIFICNTMKIEDFVRVAISIDKRYLRKFTKVFPNIDYYLDELTRDYRKNNNKTEYL